MDTQKNGLLVNVVDQPKLCTFYMGSVFQDDNLKIAISTNGKCPSFGTFLRDYIKNISFINIKYFIGGPCNPDMGFGLCIFGFNTFAYLPFIDSFFKLFM